MNENKNFSELISWIRDNGGTVSNIKIHNDDLQERGVFSTNSIRNNASIIKIPRILIIHDGMGTKTNYGRQLLRSNHAGINNLKITLVVLFILNTMRNYSFFLPYYKSLPKQLKNYPILWDDNILSLLVGSDMLNKIKNRKDKIKQDHNILCHCCPGFKNEYSFREFLYIRMLVGSRNFGIIINGIKRVAMIPLSDMLNHSTSPNVRWVYDTNKEMFIMQTNISIGGRSAIELTDSYGDKSNNLMMLYYGFGLPNNINNVLKVELNYDTHAKTRSEIKKIELYSELIGELKMNLKDNFTRNMLTFFRIMMANEDELNRFQNRIDYITPITLANEARALGGLSTYMKSMSERYIAGMDEIKELLNKADSNSAEYSALLLIYGELEIINFYIKFTEYILEYFKTNKINANPNYKEYTSLLTTVPVL